MEEKEIYLDEKTHRYVLTEAAVIDNLGINLAQELNTFGDANPAEVPPRFLRRVSMVLYNYVEKKSGNNRVAVNCWVKSAQHRAQAFAEALLNQTAYMVNNGDIGLQAGVNLKDGRAMHPEELRGIVRISPDAEDCLLNAGLLYCGWGGSYI